MTRWCQEPSATADSLNCGMELTDPFQHGLLDADRRVEAMNTLDEVAFPVSGKRPVVDLRQTHMDAEHLGQMAPAFFKSRARYAPALGTAQADNQVLAQLPAGHGLDVVIDRFVQDGALGGIGPHVLECACDRRGRQLFRYKVLHYTKGHSIDRQIGATPGLEALKAGLYTCSAGIVSTSRLSCKRKTVLPSGKALDLPVAGRGRAVRAMCRA